MKELQSIPEIETVRTVDRGTVEFRSYLGGMYTANLLARIPNRILMRLAQFVAPTTTVLYSRSTRIPWELYINPDKPLRIIPASTGSAVNHKRKIAETIDQAIRVRLRSFGLDLHSANGKEEVDGALELRVRLFRNECQISLNTSGPPLYKRNIKQMTALAPIRETLAAGLLFAADADDSDLVMDPFCGSGTLLIEAAMLQLGIAPGKYRSFAFESFPFFEREKWGAIRRRYAGERRSDATVHYLGGDLSNEAVEATSRNLSSLEVERFNVARKDAFDQDFRKIAEGYVRPLLVTNLPYGVRVANETDALRLTKSFVRKVNTDCKGWRVAIVSPFAKALEALNLNNEQRVSFQNGGTRVVAFSGVVQ